MYINVMKINMVRKFSRFLSKYKMHRVIKGMFKHSAGKWLTTLRTLSTLFFCSQCFESEFGCVDGQCIQQQYRCNEIYDCRDKSDEKNCKMVIIDKDIYRKEFPPFKGHGDKTVVAINLTIYSLGSIQESGMTFTVKFKISLRW